MRLISLCVVCVLAVVLVEDALSADNRRGWLKKHVHRHLWGSKITTCCACGTAKYRLKFLGKWTRTRHPKDHPGHLAYFSPLIGASHSNDFVLWRIGHLASSGIRKMSEYGSHAELEQEIALNGERIKSTVHSKRIASCCGSRRASFHVDKYKHLFSAMSRISPSPDWNVGVDSLDLCDHATCSWKKKIELDLEPWDAGTDSGVKFIGPNQETNPTELIHYITKRKSLNQENSFSVHGNKVPPLAKMIFHLVNTKGKCSKRFRLKSTPGLKVRISPEECDVSSWTAWTTCSVTCGLGTRARGRVVSKDSPAHLCPSLQEKNCNMETCA